MKFLIAILILDVLSVAQGSWEVSKLKGEAALIRGGQPQVLTAGTPLLLGDILRTERRSRVELSAGETKLTLGPKTTFAYKEDPLKTKAGLWELIYGKLRAVVAPAEAKSFKLKMKTVTAGVRGTEFFAQAIDSEERICTLEGTVAVNLASGDEVLVKEGRGLRISSGTAPRVVQNSPSFVDNWVAETSMESNLPVKREKYTRPRHFKPIAKKWFWGVYASALYCQESQPNLSTSGAESTSCFKNYLSPHIQYGVKDRIFVRPAVNTFAAHRVTVIDHQPLLIGDNHEALTLAEAFFESSGEGFRWKIGRQEIHWNKGILISDRLWSSELTTYDGVDAFFDIGDWNVEVLGVLGYGNTQPLSGLNHVDFLGARLHFPKALGNLYGLYTHSPDLSGNNFSRLHYGRETFNIGLYLEQKIARWHTKISGIYQKQNSLIRAGNINSTGDGHYVDTEIAYSFFNDQPLSLVFRGLAASKDFAPVQHDYYILGISHQIKNPANLTQLRLKLDWQWSANQSVYVEGIYNEEVDSSGFLSRLGSGKKNQHLGDEYNIVYNYQRSQRWQWTVGGFLFAPDQLGNKNSTGVLTRLQWTY